MKRLKQVMGSYGLPLLGLVFTCLYRHPGSKNF